MVFKKVDSKTYMYLDKPAFRVVVFHEQKIHVVGDLLDLFVAGLSVTFFWSVPPTTDKKSKSSLEIPDFVIGEPAKQLRHLAFISIPPPWASPFFLTFEYRAHRFHY